MLVYKGYVYKLLLLVFLFVVGVYPMLFYCQLGVATEDTRKSFERLQKKQDIANNISTRKIVVLSGSSTLYGIDAQKIEQLTGVPCVNMGLFGSFGFNYMFLKTQDILKDGDILLLPLEYNMYSSCRMNLSGEMNGYISSRDPEYFRTLPFQDKIKFIYSMKPLRLLHGLKARFWADPCLITNGDANSLNRHGDLTNNTVSTKVDNATLLRGKHTTIFKDKDGFLPQEVQMDLQNMVQYCKNHNIKLLVTYPPYLHPKGAFNTHDAHALNAIEIFWQQHNVPVLGKPDEFLYSVDEFYDMEYHLNEHGKTKRTMKILEYLQQYL